MPSSKPEEEKEWRETMSDDGEQNNIPVRVFTRLRPINKLEASRRSRKCVEIHTNDTVISVDSPEEGEYDYEFDKIFDETTNQAEFYNTVASSIPSRFLDGENCALVAYGQTSSGKSHTMIGSRSLSRKQSKGDSETKGPSPLESQTDTTVSATTTSATTKTEKSEFVEETQNGVPAIGDEHAGIFQRTIQDVFSRIKSSDPNTEYLIRCSFIDIYLEKIVDLLQPGSQSVNIIDIKEVIDEYFYSTNNIKTNIQGATEVCCVDEDDVMALLRRGIAYRKLHANQMATQTSRLHSFFILNLTQKDICTGIEKPSRLLFADLAGSEMALGAKKKNRAKIGNQHEVKTIKKSFNALSNVIKSLADSSAKIRPMSEAEKLKDPFHQSKLTHILKDVFGGNFFTTIILTASPASFNISETMATLRFGIKCRKIRNKQKSSAIYPASFYELKLAEARRREKDLMSFIVAMASNSRNTKTEFMESKEKADSFSGPIWDSIDTILNNCNGKGTELDPSVTKRVIGIFETNVTKNSVIVEDEKYENDDVPSMEGESRDQYVAHLRNKLKEYKSIQEGIENQLACVLSQCSELQILNTELTADKKKYISELIDSKNEIAEMSQRKLEVEHNLRTSQFRENEAAVFLRQFRRFYRRLLHNKAKQGSGDVKEITQKVPGVPDLIDLIDVDTLLLESGLIEENEIHDDTSGAGIYRPSAQALIRSAAGAKKASRLEKVMESGVEETEEESTSLQSSSYAASSGFPSMFNVNSTGVPSVSDMGDGGVSVLIDNERKVEAENVSKSEEMKTFNVSRGADDLTSIGQRKPESSNLLPLSFNGGADAGAGDSTIVGTSELNSMTSRTSGAHSTGTSTAHITEKQMMLDTPAGRLVIMNHKHTERELLQYTERCIELQIALNEEKANVDALTNRTGSLGKKRMAQEAISLRQALDRKTHDLQAIIWKMNELHLINKTYNEKMENREQHVSYLEESIVNLQNRNREMMIQNKESEKKLCDELAKLRFLVDAITNPLWQLREGGSDNKKNISSRVIMHIQGGNVQERFNASPPPEDLESVVEDEFLSDDNVSDDESISMVGNSKPTTLDSDTQTEIMAYEKGTMTELEEKEDDSGIDPVTAVALGTAVGIATGAATAALSSSSDDEAELPKVHSSAAVGKSLGGDSSNPTTLGNDASCNDNRKEVSDFDNNPVMVNKSTKPNVIDDALVAAAFGTAVITGSERSNKIETKETSTQYDIIETISSACQTDALEMKDGTTQYEAAQFNECNTKSDPIGSNENDEEASDKLDAQAPQSIGDGNKTSPSGANLASALVGTEGTSQHPKNSNGVINIDQIPPKETGISHSNDEDNLAAFELDLEHNRNSGLSEKLFLGGKLSSFVPRRFVRKVGPTIKPGVLKDYKKKASKSRDENSNRMQL